MQQPLSETLRERGYVYQNTGSSLGEVVDTPRILYWGIDPSADSMHIGQLMGILVVRRFVEAGHRVIILVGGGTGMVGDPSGKSTERNLLTDETISHNAAALHLQLKRLVGADVSMVNNAEWLRPLPLMEFLRDIGKHFTVNEMIKRDSVRPRIETPEQSISYTEFTYMLLQSYDFLHLHEIYGSDLQVGASDQWGNIVSGTDLIRRKTGNTAYAFTWPLLVDKKTGKKFGKSEGGAIWLDAAKTSPFQFYQFWLNTEDDVLEEMLLKMTLLPKDEIDATLARHEENRGERIAQKVLAFETTKLVHGEDEAMLQEALAGVLFSSITTPFAPTEELSQMLRLNAPTHRVTLGTMLVDALSESGLASSKREAREFIENGAVSLNGVVQKDIAMSLDDSMFVNGIALLKRGKRNVCVFVLE